VRCHVERGGVHLEGNELAVFRIANRLAEPHVNGQGRRVGQ